jgi:hypothetical protein
LQIICLLFFQTIRNETMGPKKFPNGKNPLPALKTAGSRAGKPNYQPELALAAIREIKPTSMAAWDAVARRYHKLSGEQEPRLPADIKRYFIRILCENNIKPTGLSGPSPLVARAQQLYHEIADMAGAASYGGEAETSIEVHVEEEVNWTGNVGKEILEDIDDLEAAGLSTSLTQPLPPPARPVPSAGLSTRARPAPSVTLSTPARPAPTASLSTPFTSPRIIESSGESISAKRRREVTRSETEGADAGSDQKTKNSRPNPRQTAGQALSSIANSIASRSELERSRGTTLNWN